MITLYTWETPNGRKPIIMLEELGLPYRVRPVDIGEHEQFHPDFLAISPNNKIPAMIDEGADQGPLTLFESGAILTYLAEQYGQLLESSGALRYRTLQWMHWQIGGLGPMLGQLGFFSKTDVALAREHFAAEAQRLLNVLDERLTEAPYVAGERYSIADIACYPWIQLTQDKMPELLEAKPALQRWLDKVGGRAAVQRAMAWRPPG